MNRDAWVRDEPRLVEAVRHVAGRGLRRWRLVTGVALLVTVAALAQRVRRGPTYIATAVMRITEGLTSSAEPTRPRDLQRYVKAIGLNRRTLQSIMHRYRVKLPVEIFRERIEVAVVQNYFLEGDDEGPRSALVTFELAAGDPETARGVIHDLTAEIAQVTEAVRAERVEHQRQAYAEALAAVRQRVRALDDEILRLAATRAPFTKIVDLEIIKAAFLQRVVGLERGAAAIELAEGAQRIGLGLSLEVVDEDLDVFGAPLSAEQIGLYGTAALAILFPLCLVVIGAFDRRIYSRDDLVQAGIPVLGVLSRFAGDAAGSLEERERRRRR